MKWSDYIWLFVFAFSIHIIQIYKLFELNLYTASLVYKFSENYQMVSIYVILAILSGFAVLLSIFLPEMCVDISKIVLKLLVRYLHQLNPQVALQMNLDQLI